MPTIDTIGEEQDSILIVEDNTELRNFIASGFRHQFTILSATNGEEGYDMATAHIPDLVISDVMMPKVNGLDFTNSIKTDERTCHVPVILLTARADSASRIEGLKNWTQTTTWQNHFRWKNCRSGFITFWIFESALPKT